MVGPGQDGVTQVNLSVREAPALPIVVREGPIGELTFGLLSDRERVVEFPDTTRQEELFTLLIR